MTGGPSQQPEKVRNLDGETQTGDLQGKEALSTSSNSTPNCFVCFCCLRKVPHHIGVSVARGNTEQLWLSIFSTVLSVFHAFLPPTSPLRMALFGSVPTPKSHGKDHRKASVSGGPLGPSMLTVASKAMPLVP